MTTSDPEHHARPAPDVPLHIFLSRKLDERDDLTNVEVARRLGYARPNVVAMIRTGTMRVPLSKVRAIADMLGIDAIALLRRVLSEYDPDLWATLEDLLQTPLVSTNEFNVLRLLRDLTRGHDPDLAGNKMFGAGFAALVGQCMDSSLMSELAVRRAPLGSRVSTVMEANLQLEELCRTQTAERIALRRRLLGASG